MIERSYLLGFLMFAALLAVVIVLASTLPPPIPPVSNPTQEAVPPPMPNLDCESIKATDVGYVCTRADGTQVVVDEPSPK